LTVSVPSLPIPRVGNSQSITDTLQPYGCTDWEQLYKLVLLNFISVTFGVNYNFTIYFVAHYPVSYFITLFSLNSSIFVICLKASDLNCR